MRHILPCLHEVHPILHDSFAEIFLPLIVKCWPRSDHDWGAEDVLQVLRMYKVLPWLLQAPDGDSGIILHLVEIRVQPFSCKTVFCKLVMYFIPTSQKPKYALITFVSNIWKSGRQCHVSSLCITSHGSRFVRCIIRQMAYPNTL